MYTYDDYMKLLNEAVKYLKEESNKGSNLENIND